MRPHLARRFAVCLWTGGIFCCFAALGLTVHLVVSLFATPAKPGLAVSTAPLRVRTPPAPRTLAWFQDIWTTPIIEDAPPAPPVEKPQPPPKPPAPPISLPLAWVGVVVHSDPARSVAILLDKRSNRQLLLRLGSTLLDSPAKVTEISKDHVKFQVTDSIVVIERPQPWKNLGQLKPKSKLPPCLSDTIRQDDNKIIIERPALLAQYGLQSQDQIIAIAGQRMHNAEKLAEAIAQSGQTTTEIAVLRQGKIVSLSLPSAVASQLVARRK
jgi:hypothetical protein